MPPSPKDGSGFPEPVSKPQLCAAYRGLAPCHRRELNMMQGGNARAWPGSPALPAPCLCVCLRGCCTCPRMDPPTHLPSNSCIYCMAPVDRNLPPGSLWMATSLFWKSY